MFIIVLLTKLQKAARIVSQFAGW